jgi:3-oxoacyl-[acyl-carrier-protein] synthase III
VIVTVDQHGNTSAASVLALSVAVADGRIRKGDLVLLEAMGGGFTGCGAAALVGRDRFLTLPDQFPNVAPVWN